MAAIAREQENRIDLINWFISIGGVLTDAHQVDFRIFDITGGLPGTQIFPVTPGDYETVTSGTGNFSTGSYYAYDNANAKGWTPSATENVGTHRIEWRWKALATSPFQSGVEDFEVLLSSTGGTGDEYISVQDLRNLGMLEEDYSDALLLASINLWQSVIERLTRQWFNPRTLVLSVDGTNCDALHFGVPIISIEYLKLNSSTTNLDPTYYKVYNGKSYPDDRRNPRIKLLALDDFSDIYTAPISDYSMIFRKGRQNQVIKGIFGFVESNGLTPEPIKRALTRLVVEKVTQPVYHTPFTPYVVPTPILTGVVIEEWTDGHKRRFSDVQKTAFLRPTPAHGITYDPEILSILKLYRAPIGIASPAQPSHR